MRRADFLLAVRGTLERSRFAARETRLNLLATIEEAARLGGFYPSHHVL